MSITSDQLRAARILLHLHQKQLATVSRVSLSTIRRFEGGLDIRYLHADALRRALVEAGAIFIDADTDANLPPGTVGVALRRADDLPEETRQRIAAERQTSDTAKAEGTPGAAEGPGSDDG